MAPVRNLLIREGHVPINIKFIDRSLYYDAFNAFDQNADIRIMEDIVRNAICSSYHKRLAYLESKQIITLNEYAKTEKIIALKFAEQSQTSDNRIFLGAWEMASRYLKSPCFLDLTYFKAPFIY